MKKPLSFPESSVYQRGLVIFLTETPPTDTPEHLFRPLYSRNPHFPALRSDPMALSGASRRKQILCSWEACLLAFISVTAHVSPLQAQSSPLRPAIDRDVHVFESDAEVNGSSDNDQLHFIRPALTNHRTSLDGRLALGMKLRGFRLLEFYLLKPEALSNHFTEGQPGLGGTMDTNVTLVDDAQLHDLVPGSEQVRQLTLIDTTEDKNPQAVLDTALGEYVDVYYIKIFATVDYDDESGVERSKFQITPIRVSVRYPKTANAVIHRIEIDTRPGQQKEVSEFHNGEAHDILEPMITEDGKLMVSRIGTSYFAWTDHEGVRGPRGTGYVNRYQDVVYAYSSNGTIHGADGPGGVDGFENMLPLSYANSDTRINQQYGFAKYPMRDSMNRAIEYIPDETVKSTLYPGDDMHVSYPWIDKNGDNVFFTTISASLRLEGEEYPDRFPNTALPGTSGFDYTADAGSATRGAAVVGLWTQGKIVQLDNLINNTDFGIGSPVNEHRVVRLYHTNDNDEGTKRIGGGRDNGGNISAPAGADRNTTFIDSTENKLNFSEHLKPRTPADVVWTMSSGKGSDEFAFDDYLNINGFIVSNMTGAISYNLSGLAFRDPTHHDGFDINTNVFNSADVKVSNDAAALPDRWKIPTHGAPTENIRIEPIASGGIKGKGLWLGQNSGIAYEIPAQSETGSGDAAKMNGTDWYVGIFIDCRFANTVERNLIQFPDASSIRLGGRGTILYYDGSNNLRATIPLGAQLQLPNRGWAHLAVQVFSGGERVDLYHNGFLFHRHVDPANKLFRMTDGDDSGTNGTLYVGKVPGSTLSGLRAWIDDFKVFAQTFDPEVCANLAYGTVVGFSDTTNAQLMNKALAYDENGSNGLGRSELDLFLAYNGQQRYDHYAVWCDYSDDFAAHLGNIPEDVTSLRDNIIFPEAPLFHDAPRPNSSQNRSCFSCHTPEFDLGLGMDALELRSGIVAKDDARRQPLQSSRSVYGVIPNSWLGTNVAGGNYNTGDGLLIDTILLEANDPSARSVNSFLLLFADTKEPIKLLEDGEDIDLSEIDAGRDLMVRANLDSAQGSVDLSLEQVLSGSLVQVSADDTPYSILDNRLKDADSSLHEYQLTATPNTGGITAPSKEIRFSFFNSSLDRSGFEAWARNLRIPADYNADSDGDSESDFKEYAFGSDPLDNASRPMQPQLRRVGDLIDLTYLMRNDDDLLNYRIMMNPNLSPDQWDYYTPQSPAGSGNAYEMNTVEFEILGVPQMFFRIEADVKKPPAE